MVYTTEIASDQLIADNPIHQRLLKAYHLCQPHVQGVVLEVGCGEGRGIDIIKSQAKSYLGIDKNEGILNKLSAEYPELNFEKKTIPPFNGINDNQFDTVISFQVIEHIKDDELFIRECHRVLKPDGKLILTTPNIDMSLTRNPWHVREYKRGELAQKLQTHFQKVQVSTITGSELVMDYYEKNKVAVNKITRFDILNLQYRLPAPSLRLAYDLLNRLNRNRLNHHNKELVSQISQSDFFLQDVDKDGFDFFCVCEKLS